MIWTRKDNKAGEVTWALPLTLATPWVPHLTLRCNNDMKTKVPDPQRDTQVSSRRGWNKVTKETQNGVCRREKDVCSMCLLCRERCRCHGNRQQGCLTQTQKISAWSNIHWVMGRSGSYTGKDTEKKLCFRQREVIENCQPNRDLMKGKQSSHSWETKCIEMRPLEEMS